VTRLADVVRTLGVRPRRIRRLAARANIHWLVTPETSQAMVLRRFSAAATEPDILWETGLLQDLRAAGLPVAAPIEAPRLLDGAWWALFPRLVGRPLAAANTDETGYRELGRLLAGYHAVAARLPPRPQRQGWCELSQAHRPLPTAPPRNALLEHLSCLNPERGERFGKAAERLEARELEKRLASLPRLAIHGDFSPWNVLVSGGKLTGLLDFELAHWDTAAADLAFARRGSHDAVVWGYLDHADLSLEELAALDGLWSGAVLFGAWKVIERTPREASPDPVALQWNFEQLTKTRPYRPPP
jgi:Ser/Thr protein kinase RdoA (MazF antagonist)